MKFVSWNCNGAFRNKFDKIANFDADIYIIQECENPAETHNERYLSWADNYLWVGDTKNKGLGIFSASSIRIELLNWSNLFKDHSVKHFLPCRVNNDFNLLGVWTHRNNSPNFGYIGQFWKYLQLNKSELSNSIIVGDFNSNAIWDQWDRWWNHSDVVNDLNEIGLVSYYHIHNNEMQGKETVPTFYFQKKLNRPYHIDYMFGPINRFTHQSIFEIGNPDQWLSLSDHMPIICEIK